MKKWSVTVTTVPQRRDNLLTRTLDSLRGAGFKNIRLAVDGCRDQFEWERQFGFSVSGRHPQIKAFGNWYLALLEALIREPESDYFMMCQDDCLLYPNLKQYLETCKMPEGNFYLNLYTFQRNEDIIKGQKVGWHKASLLSPTTNQEMQTGRGAVCLVFPRLSVPVLLSAEHMVNRPMDARKERAVRNIDGAVVSAMNKAGYTEYVHNPSLVQHTGDVSVIGNGHFPLAKSWRGELFNALDLLTES